MPKVRSTGMGQSSSARPKPNEVPVQKSSGPYVTRIPVNAVPGDNNGFNQQVPHQEPKPSPLKVIEDIYNEVESLHKEVNEFSGEYQDKQYRYLDEMLTRCMIKLDNVDTEGDEQIRQARKRAINAVHQCVSLLENRGNRPSKTNVTEESSEDQTHINDLAPTEINSVDNSLGINETQKSSSSGHVPYEETPV